MYIRRTEYCKKRERSLQIALSNLGLASRGDLGGIRTEDELQERASLELADLKGILDKGQIEKVDNDLIYESIGTHEVM